MRFTRSIRILYVCLFLRFIAGIPGGQPIQAQVLFKPLDSASFVKKFPDRKLLDQGKLTLYSVTRYESDFLSVWNHAEPALSSAGMLFQLTEGPVERYCVQLRGMVDLQFAYSEFWGKLNEWFEGDTALKRYIGRNKIGPVHLPYLVRMYNRHAPRPFDADSLQEPLTFIDDGFLDERDGKRYDILLANHQTWLAENLTYRPGSNFIDSCLDGKNFPGYYTWTEALHACPTGWRLPAETDWKTLFVAYGLNLERIHRQSGMDKDGSVGNRLLKSSSRPDGFNAVQAGFLKDCMVKEENESAYFWVDKQEYLASADAMQIWKSSKNKVEMVYYLKSKRFNVRCVKANP